MSLLTQKGLTTFLSYAVGLAGSRDEQGVERQAPAAHLTSWMTDLVMLPLSHRYPSEQASSSGVDRFFTSCNQALGLGFRMFPLSISAQAIAANASSVCNKENWHVTKQDAPPRHPESQVPVCSGVQARKLLLHYFADVPIKNLFRTWLCKPSAPTMESKALTEGRCRWPSPKEHIPFHSQPSCASLLLD